MEKQALGRTCAFRAIGVLLALWLLPCGLAFAQVQTQAQWSCIIELNKNFEKVAKAQSKDVCACIRDGAKEKLGGTIEDCITSDPKGKVAKAKAKTLSRAQSRCTEPPDFGATDPNTVNRVAVTKELDLIHRIFGSDLDSAIILQSDDKAGSKCQVGVAKQAKKCQDAKLKIFNKCKKHDLDLVTDPNGLEACMGVDPKGRVEKACDTNLADKIGKKCGGSVDAAAAFPGCGTGDLGELKDCIDAMVECAVCKSLNEADDLSRDCEAFDDGQTNGSCPFGGRCGNNILEGAEECDDGNTFKGDGCSDICVVEFCGDGGFQPGLGEECDDGNMADADGCSAACVVEFCGDGIVQSGIGEDCEDDLACDAGETCDPVVCQCKPAGLEIGPHRCLLDPNSGFVIDTQLAPLAFGFTGSLDIVCGIVDSNSGKAACTCAIQEVDPVNIPGIGYACLNAGGPCAAGEIDCDGGNGLDVDLLTEHNIGACTGDADCRAQCTTHCGASMLFSATCEGFCLFGPNDGKPCTQDTDCPGGSCHGGDGLPHGNICNCYCVDMGGGPSRAGGLKCNLGTNIVIETAAPPCGDGDDLLTVGAQCVPLTTETVTSIVIDANDMALKELPPGGLAATGAPADCLDLAGSVTAGTRLVGAVSFVDTNLGDTAITLVFGCQ